MLLKPQCLLIKLGKYKEWWLSEKVQLSRRYFIEQFSKDVKTYYFLKKLLMIKNNLTILFNIAKNKLFKINRSLTGEGSLTLRILKNMKNLLLNILIRSKIFVGKFHLNGM